MLVLQVTVDGFWAADNFNVGALASEVLRQEARISVGVVTTNYDESIKAKISAVLQ